MKGSVEKFIHVENIKNFMKRLESVTDEAQRKTLLTLLAEEEAKAKQAREGEAPKGLAVGRR